MEMEFSFVVKRGIRKWLSFIRHSREETSMNVPYYVPFFKGEAFNCPQCNAYAHQKWSRLTSQTHAEPQEFSVKDELYASFCVKCKTYALWHHSSMIYPMPYIAPPPVPQVPWDVQADYLEARKVVGESPRAAAALLRLALQKLMVHLGEPGNNLNDEIGNLVAKGLPEKVQKALDTVRVVGNNAVHPGQLNIKDDRQTAMALFDLINIVVETMIVQPKRVNELYAKLPQTAVAQINRRDNKL
jgi:hypothetical protein